jgi:hypothetical protein
MNENQIIALCCLVAVAARIPRMIERWKAPLLRGTGWFFSVEVPPDFLMGPGASILQRYRVRLFWPWMAELPIAAALLLSGGTRYIFFLVGAATLLTRLNYYLARAAAEKQARQFELPEASAPVSTISLSLRPRTLRDYATPWMEAVIGLSILAPVFWLGYRYAVTGDWEAIHRPLAGALFYIYVQAGALLVKRGVVHARYAAPAASAEQHLAWRESLRRLSASICDYARLMFAAASGVMASLSILSVGASSKQTMSIICMLAVGVVATCFEWKRRLQHLEIARRTKPAKLFAAPDISDPVRIVCFQPAMPMLLLSGPYGYALNLASASAITIGLYLAGYVVLRIWVAHLGG